MTEREAFEKTLSEEEPYLRVGQLLNFWFERESGGRLRLLPFRCFPVGVTFEWLRAIHPDRDFICLMGDEETVWRGKWT